MVKSTARNNTKTYTIMLIFYTIFLFNFVKSGSLCDKLIKESPDDRILMTEITQNMHDLKNESSQLEIELYII